MKVSVITVCFNSEKTIADCVKSVASQNWTDLEHIIIDGNSTDSTLLVAEKHKHVNTTVISEPDSGVYDAMNKGLNIAEGEYVIYLNSDDLFANATVISSLAEKALESGVDCVLGDVKFFDNTPGEPGGRHYRCQRFAPWWIKIGTMPPHPGFFARKSLLVAAGGFDRVYKIASDFDLVARLILQHEASWAVLGRTVTLFRNGGLSTGDRWASVQITREAARSLSNLSVPFPSVMVLLKYPFKLMQFFQTKKEMPAKGTIA